MINVLAIIICLAIVVFNKLSFFFLFLLCFLIIYFIYRIVKEYKNNKKYNHKLFKKVEKINQIDYVLNSINHIKKTKKFIIKDDVIILILQCGIYYIYVSNCDRYLKGNIEDEFLIEQSSSGDKKFLNIYKNYLKYYDKLNIDEEAKKIFLINNNAIFNVLVDAKVLSTKQLYYYLIKELNHKKYDDEKIEEMYNKISL